MMEWKFATTLIGSMPFSEPEDALKKILDGRVDCPSWPQLSRGMKESMYVQTGAHLPGLRVNEDKVFVDLNDYDPTEVYEAIISEDEDFFKPPEKCHAGLYGLLKNDVSRFRAVKGQVTGPISEGLQIQDTDGRSVIYDEMYGEIVRKSVCMTARWQARRLMKANDCVIMFFDEPSLSLLGSPFAQINEDDAVDWLNEAMEGVEGFRAIHCCGNTDWGMVLRTGLDILSFDAYNYSSNLALYTDDLKAFMDRGGALSWGIVPNREEDLEKETVRSLCAKLEKAMDRLRSKGIDKQQVARRSLLTPQCGLEGLSPGAVDSVLELLSGVSREMKGRYGF
jgi:methionine synthase II (cobalamin-independent)